MSEAGSLPESFEDFAINLPDRTFEAVVREIIGKPEGAILASDVAKATELDISNTGIVNFQDMEYFTNLATLSCIANKMAKLLLWNSLFILFLLSRSSRLRSRISPHPIGKEIIHEINQ